MKIRALVDKQDQDTVRHDWRINIPFKHLRANCIDADVIDYDTLVDEDTTILILPKLYVCKEDRESTIDWLNALKEAGIVVVYDADDDMWSESFTQYMTQLQWCPSKGKELLNALLIELEARRENHIWIINQCDAIIVSNNILAERVKKYLSSNIPVFVVNNAIDVDNFEQQLEHKTKQIDRKVIGWAGGSRPQQDLVVMLEAWAKIAKTRDDVEFVIAGWYPEITDICLYEKLKHILWTSKDNYAKGMQVDIGCVSVSDTPFTKAKSQIKAWEFSLAGALVIGSNSLYNTEPIVHCETVDDWVNSLNFYLDNNKARQEFADAYTKYVKCYYDIKYNWVYWMDAYSKILYETSKIKEKNYDSAIV